MLPCGQGQGSTACKCPFCRRSACIRCDTVGTGHAGEVQQRNPSSSRPLSPSAPRVLLSVLLPSNSNKHLKDKPDRSVSVCFVCLFLRLLPELTLSPPSNSLVSGFAAGAMLVLGLPPPAWAVLHAPPTVLSLASLSTRFMCSFPSVCRSSCKVKQYETPALVLDGCTQVGGSRQGVLSILSSQLHGPALIPQAHLCPANPCMP